MTPILIKNLFQNQIKPAAAEAADPSPKNFL
jgi:hypothetical protein